MQPAHTEADLDPQSKAELAIAQAFLRPLEFAVSYTHLVVPCPFCPRAGNNNSVAERLKRAEYDYWFALAGGYDSASLHCDLHKTSFHLLSVTRSSAAIFSTRTCSQAQKFKTLPNKQKKFENCTAFQISTCN